MRRRSVGAIGLGAAAAATASVFACQQLVGIPGDPPVPTAVSACGLPYGNNACASCVATSCCTESSACAADPVCSAYETCLGKSNGDWQLRSQCAIDNPVTSSPEVSFLSACLAASCIDGCGLTCGGLAANFTLPATAGACQQCAAGSSASCASEQACASSEACDAVGRCRVACETIGCVEGCLSAQDAGVDLYISWNAVLHGTCSAPCALGEDWSCVGRVSYPNRKSDTTTLTVDVVDYGTNSSLSGVDVSVCDGMDEVCNPPGLADGGPTDSHGTVVIQVPNQMQLSGLGLNGYLLLTSPSIVPDLFYWGFPLSESAFGLSSDAPFFYNPVRVVTPDEAAVLAESLHITPDATMGTLAIVVGDCRLHGAPGVTVTTNVVGLQATYALSPGLTATDSSGIVTFANVPPGRVDLTASPVALGGKASSRMTVTVRAGFETTVIMMPTP